MVLYRSLNLAKKLWGYFIQKIFYKNFAKSKSCIYLLPGESFYLLTLTFLMGRRVGTNGLLETFNKKEMEWNFCNFLINVGVIAISKQGLR